MEKQLTIYIGRYGEDQEVNDGTLRGHHDDSLHEYKQTMQLAETIKKFGLKFEGVYTSPLKRTDQASAVITSFFNLPLPWPVRLDALIERNLGCWAGKTPEQIIRDCQPQIYETRGKIYLVDPPGAETFDDLIERSRTVLDFIVREHQSGNVLIITHGDIGKMIFAAYYGLSWKKALSMFHFNYNNLIKLEKNLPVYAETECVNFIL